MRKAKRERNLEVYPFAIMGKCKSTPLAVRLNAYSAKSFAEVALKIDCLESEAWANCFERFWVRDERNLQAGG